MLAIVLLFLVPVVLADQLYVVSPSGKETLVATCAPGESCTRDNIDRDFCNEEGQWRVHFVGAFGSSVSDSHFVEWNTKSYCRSACMPVKGGVATIPGWSDDAQLCCGDDQDVSAAAYDCGKRASSSLCVESSRTSTTRTWKWLHVLTDVGRITDAFCGNVQVVAAGGSFHSCGESNISRFARTFATVKKKVLLLDGVNDAVDLGDTGPSSSAFSISLMVKGASVNRTQRLVSKFGDVGTFRLQVTPTGKPQFVVRTEDGEFTVTGSRVVTDGAWHHVAAVYTGSQVQVFFDGIIDTVASAHGDVVVSSTKTLVGSEVAQPLVFGGQLDDLRIFGRVLSVDEARQQYLAWWSGLQPALGAGVIAAYEFEGDAVDVSGNGRTGAFVNGASTTEASILVTAPQSGSATSPLVIANATKDGKLHGYACFVDASEKARLAECSGSAAPLSSSGVIKGPGGGVRSVAGFARDVDWYCKSDGAWAIDLDDDSVACAGGGFTWTGRRCCSEGDDLVEYYNDPYLGEGTGGGCWNKTFIGFGKFTSTDKRVINVNGTFHGCNVSNSSDLLRVQDQASCEAVLAGSNDVPCTVFVNAQGTNKHVFCGASGQWLADAKGNRSRLSTIVWGNVSAPNRSECCAPGDCWDGKVCVQNQLISAEDKTTEGFRCINGSWSVQPLKFNWDRFKRGFCPVESQCLVDPLGRFENNGKPELFFNGSSQGPQCIDDGQYVLDYYCDKGNWTTRSKLVGLQLADVGKRLAQGNFAMYCDVPRAAMAFINYTVFARPAAEYVDECPIGSSSYPCVNNVCVLRYGNDVAFGTSINTPINGSRSVLLALNKSASLCDGVSRNASNAVSCGQNVYYNPALQLVFVVPRGAPAVAVSDVPLSTPYRAIQSFVFNRLQSPTQDFSFFNNSRLFGKWYAAEGSGASSVFSFLEEGIFDSSVGKARDHIGVKYNNVGEVDVCRLVQSYPPNQEFVSPASCNATGPGEVQIVAHRTQAGGLVGVWRDLTGKLRVS